jgi:uncharacterized membrane protein YedE/YeeE
MEEIPVTTMIGTIGFGLGVFFGAVAQRTDFCTMGSISDIVFMGSWNRFRAWVLAIAVATVASQAMHIGGLIDLNKSIYLTPNLGWAGAIIGGLLFGFGMTMTGGCGVKTLVRLGAGNLKSLVAAIFLGIFAYATLRGLTGLARVELEGWTNINLTESAGIPAQGIPDLLAALFGSPVETMRLAVVAIVVLVMFWFCFKSADFRASARNIFAGAAIGLMIAAAWYVTGVIGYDDFEPMPLASLTFVNPVGESIQYLMTFTGSTINFGIATVGGVIVGSFISAKAANQFRVESFTETGDMIRHMVGGSIMGIGGIVAMGCTVGQAMTGMSTLAFSSLLAWISIVAGALYGMKYLEEGSFGAAFNALFARG